MLLSRLAGSPLVTASFTFILLYAAAILCLRFYSYRDPTSVFFDPKVAYKTRYTDVRRQEAASFMQDLDSNPFRRASNQSSPFVCLGIPTLTREGVRYFRDCVGSIFHGLDDRERQEIFFMPFIAQTRPTTHPAYQERWLSNVADSVLEYDLPEAQIDHIKNLEDDSDFARKALFDYRYLLEKCADTGAEYIAVLEDDVVALHGWYHRMRHALRLAETMSHLRGSRSFLYLRLFYTEEFFGWNTEDWPHYLFWSVSLDISVAIFCICIRSLHSSYKYILSNRSIVCICGLFVPSCIALFFMAGRISTIGLSHGVHQMDKYGCCAQGMVYPKDKIPELINWYRAKNSGMADSLTEELADSTGDLRWALVPSVLQHVGRQSSKGIDDDAVAAKIWNFEFEMNDAATLKDEHSKEIELINT